MNGSPPIFLILLGVGCVGIPVVIGVVAAIMFFATRSNDDRPKE